MAGVKMVRGLDLTDQELESVAGGWTGSSVIAAADKGADKGSSIGRGLAGGVGGIVGGAIGAIVGAIGALLD